LPAITITLVRDFASPIFLPNLPIHSFFIFFLFLGKIRAIQLDYTEAHKHLMQALRKAPQSPMAPGFQQAVSKLLIIVQLLLGEIPERSVFRQPVLRKPLVPYLHITQAVRVGDLPAFLRAMQEYSAQFQKDKTYTLILRLRHNVIKTGIRMVSLSYSRIPLKDICTKLHLDTEEDAEFIVAKVRTLLPLCSMSQLVLPCFNPFPSSK